jgi:hypothetical protein
MCLNYFIDAMQVKLFKEDIKPDEFALHYLIN